MTTNEKFPGYFKLTQKKARQLAVQELGTAKGLKPCAGLIQGFYEMQIGCLNIQIHPDFYGSNCIVIEVRSGGYGVCRQFHDQITLQQNFEAEDQYRREEREELKKELMEENVVRCRDCGVPHNKYTGCPKLKGLITPPDFYCGFGERR